MTRTKILFAVLLFPAFAFAQNDCLDRYDQEGIYLRSELFRGTSFVQNGISRPVGFLYKNLKPAFETTPRAIPTFKKARRNAKISFGVSMLGLAGAATGTWMVVSSVD